MSAMRANATIFICDSSAMPWRDTAFEGENIINKINSLYKILIRAPLVRAQVEEPNK